jgi:YidC/Oxa1 family membrane protein insertase
LKLPGADFLRDRAAVGAFEAQDASFRNLVFYSEGAGDWPHIGPVVEELLRHHDVQVSYLSSDPTDPGLAIEDPRVHGFNVGTGTARTILFARMDCRHFVMTLPDLGNLWLKRSVRPVHYVYLFHSMNSTHTSYRTGAFDGFDTIFCVGPHHVDEIRRTEEVYGLPAKELVEHGSAKLDALLATISDSPAPSQGRRVLLAPTWGESSFIERPIGVQVVRALVQRGIETTVRLHPMTARRLPKIAADLRREFSAVPTFTVEDNMSATESWALSDVMISDWSGAATEYAFALGKPVIYIDTPPKIMNPEWERVGLPSFESSIRELIGRVVSLDAVDRVPDVVAGSIAAATSVRERSFQARNRMIFNVGRSSEAAAAYLAEAAAGR